MNVGLILVGDDEPPTRCRHCARWLRYVGSFLGGAQLWLDSEDLANCAPNLIHAPMPDEADLRLAVLEAFHPEEFRQ